MDTIGAFEAKTHLSQLLERVSKGESLTITRHGKPVARLVPVEQANQARATAAADRIRKRRAALRGARMAELMNTIHQGHRY